MSTVTVTSVGKDSTNVIGVYEGNPELGWVRVEQTATAINEKGWLTKNRRSTFIKGKVEDLAEQNYQIGQEIPGKIVIKESFTPFNQENPDMDLKIAGDTGVVCRVDDQPIYRQSFYTNNVDAQDELIMHTNSEEIKQVIAAARALGSLRGATAEL